MTVVAERIGALGSRHDRDRGRFDRPRHQLEFGEHVRQIGGRGEKFEIGGERGDGATNLFGLGERGRPTDIAFDAPVRSGPGGVGGSRTPRGARTRRRTTVGWGDAIRYEHMYDSGIGVAQSPIEPHR